MKFTFETDTVFTLTLTETEMKIIEDSMNVVDNHYAELCDSMAEYWGQQAVNELWNELYTARCAARGVE